MTDLATTEAPVSTTLEINEPANVSGGGTPRIPEEPAKEPSLRDTIAAAAKESAKEESAPDADTDKDDSKAAGKAEATKGPEKPQDGKEADAKAEDTKEPAKAAERAPDGKFAPKQAEEQDTKPEPKPTGHIEPPKNFLPDAKETWRNTPRAVQRDVSNAIKQHEAEVAQYREVAERFAPLREFDELVRANGRAGLHETLAEVKQLEDMMSSNPIAALNQVLMRAGPRKPDGQAYSLYEVAQAVVNSGQDNYHQTVSQASQQQQQPQEDPRVAQLEQQLAQVQHQQLAATVIDPFKADHPRYDELQEDIAFFLRSGKIPTSLSPHDRLEAAYDMAARINPASHDNDAAEPQASPEPRNRAVTDLSGSKSIKSAPGAVSADMEPDRGGSTRELLMQEMRRQSRK